MNRRYPCWLALLFGALTALACAGGQTRDPAPQPTVPVVDGGFTTQLGTVVRYLGFEPILPRAVPAYLDLDSGPEVLVANGEPFAVLIAYHSHDTPGVEVVVDSFVLDEQAGGLPNFGLDAETVAIRDVTVFIASEIGKVRADWTTGGLTFTATFFGVDREGGQAQLKAAALHIIQSMLE